MRTFAQKPKATQQTTSAKSTIPSRTHFGQSREVNSMLHLQRTIGNQAVQRLLQTHAEELKAGLTGTASPRFGHDFSQIPIYATAPVRTQTKLTINTSRRRIRAGSGPDCRSGDGNASVSPPVAARHPVSSVSQDNRMGRWMRHPPV